MAKCKYETKNGRCGLKDSYAYRHKCYTEEFCKCHEDIEPCGRHEPITNADRIRAMSDEELCDFLSQYKFCDICVEGCADCTYHGDCDKRLLEWLKQPADMRGEEE